MLKLLSIVCLSFTCGTVPAESGKDVSSAPAPAAVREARKVFLINDGASDRAYNAFRSAVETWGRYRIVGSPGEAEVVVELAYRVGQGRSWLRDEDYDRRYPVLATTTLTIFDAGSKKWLWWSVDSRRLAFRQKNRDKDAANSAHRLVEEWKIAVRDAK